MHFEIISPVEKAKTIARGKGIRELKRLVKVHGQGRWRKRKGNSHNQVQRWLHPRGGVTLVRSHRHRKAGI